MQTLVRLGERNKLPWTVTDRCLLAATTAVVGREGNASNLQSESGHRRPQLIENTSGFLFKIHAVGDMLFDPERMCWLGNESELEDFDFDFDSDDEPQARDKRADLTEGVESGSQSSSSDFDSDDEPQARDKLADLKEGVESGSQRLYDQLMRHETSLQRADTNAHCCRPSPTSPSMSGQPSSDLLSGHCTPQMRAPDASAENHQRPDLESVPSGSQSSS